MIFYAKHESSSLVEPEAVSNDCPPQGFKTYF